MTEPLKYDASFKLVKTPTGIDGFDDISGGGLPSGRTTVVMGPTGAGKTVFSLEFLARGALQFGEPGVFITFEESMAEILANSASFGINTDELVSDGKLVIDHLDIDPYEVTETGRYDLTGLQLRIGHAIDSIGARRIVLDGVPALFYGFTDTSIVRNALSRLFIWLKSRGLTTVITAESHTELSRHGFGLSLCDCIVEITMKSVEGLYTRHIRIAKYRGTSHSSSDFPFIIGREGISIIPITSVNADYEASGERITTGVPRLDRMLGGKGYYRGSSILISGSAGTGKTSLAAHMAEATCKRGQRALYIAFEESEHEIMRNLHSIGVDLHQAVKSGNLLFISSRSTMYGLETHLANLERQVKSFQPHVVIMDPISNMLNIGTPRQVRVMLSRFIDFLKNLQITFLFTSLSMSEMPRSDVGVSSIVDTWIVLRNIETQGEQSRLLYILKSRGMAHSNQVREFVLREGGVDLIDVYLGPEGVLTGTQRSIHEQKERAHEEYRKKQLRSREREFKQKRASLEAQLAAIRSRIEASDAEIEQIREEAIEYEEKLATNRKKRGDMRGSDK